MFIKQCKKVSMRELIPFIKSLYFHNFLNLFNQVSMINYTILHFGFQEYSSETELAIILCLRQKTTLG